MLRAIVGVLSLGLLATLLVDTAESAPRGRGARSAVSRTGGAATRTAGSGRQLPDAASNFNSVRPTGPISATTGAQPLPKLPQGAASNLQGIQSGDLKHHDQLPDASPFQGQFQSQLSNAQGTLQGKLSDAATAYGVNAGGTAPFSPAWYAQHPNAWQVTHPYAGEAVIAATAVGLASFMAIESAALSGSDTVVVYGSEATAEQAQAATELAQAGEVAVAPEGQWMPIGVFSFRPTDGPNATRMIHLAVNPQGMLRGAHYDLLSEETTDILGAVDRNTAQVSWRIGENGHAVFESTLAQLTQPQGQVRIHFPDGQTGQWTVTRVQQ